MTALTPIESIRAVRLTAITLCLFGAAVLSWEFFRYLVVFPGASVLAVALEVPLLLVGFPLLRLLRPVRAPALTWSAAAVAWGATSAAGCALLANQGLIGLWAKIAGTRFAASWSASMSAPLNEEILKVCGVVMIVLAAPLIIRGPVDGMIYGALVGLGFQAIENVTYGLNNIVLSGATDPARAVTNSALVRLGLTSLGSHWTMTAVAGAGIGYLVVHVRDPQRGGALRAAACLAGAMAMHLLFDAPQPVIEVKVAVNFIAVGALYLLITSAYLSRARGVLAGWAAAGVISHDEESDILSRRSRRRRDEPAGANSGAARDRRLARQRAILSEVDSEAA